MNSQEQNFKIDHYVDITGEKCPIPLIMTRRIIKIAKNNDIIEIKGTLEEEVSKKEILFALDSLNQEIIERIEDEEKLNWKIIIKKVENE